LLKRPSLIRRIDTYLNRAGADFFAVDEPDAGDLPDTGSAKKTPDPFFTVNLF
jgi:hypothetical protein